jgi:hypothetical protein
MSVPPDVLVRTLSAECWIRSEAFVEDVRGGQRGRWDKGVMG